MNGSRIEGVIAITDSQESGGLDKGGLAETGDIFEFFAVGEGAVFLTVFVDPSGGQLVEARYVFQQRGAGCVDVDADSVDTEVNDLIERIGKMFGFNIVLVHPDADVGGRDFYEFG